jgi:hypothetical protein
LFAQESNTSKATFGELVNDGDNFLSSTGWKDVTFNNVFGFSRFGANIQDGWLDLGAGAKLGSAYLGLYYNGLVIGQAAGDSSSYTAYLKGGDSEPVKIGNIRKANLKATYGLLLGLSNTGVKFLYEDDLRVTGGGATQGDEIWRGSLTPAVELGGAFGPLSKIRLSLPIVYNRREQVNVVAGGTPADGNAVTYTTTTLNATGGTVAGNNLVTAAAVGNYVEPDLYLKFGFGAFTLENDLSLRIYGVPAGKTNGKTGVQGGVANVTAWYDASTGNYTRYAVWDSRFYISDEVVPSYNFSGDTGKLNYSATVYLPIKLTLTTHSLNAKGEVSVSSTETEVKGYYKGVDFDMEISPNVAAGVQFKPLSFFSVQGGINAEFFTWGLQGRSTSKVDPYTAADNPDQFALVTNALVNITNSNKTSGSTNTLALPRLSFAAGFTLAFKETAALDFVFIKVAQPTAAGTIYKAVGDGLGSDEASVVLTVKF